MMGNRKHYGGLCALAMIVSALVFPSCVYDTEFAYLNDQIIALNKRVKALEDTLDTRLDRDLGARLENIQSNQAGLSAEMEELRGDMGKLSGRVENSEQVVKRTVERDITDQDALQATVGSLATRVVALESVVRQQQDYLGLELTPLAKKPEEGKATAAPPAASDKEVSAKVEPISPDVALYDKSLALFREGRFEDAMGGFRDFLKRYPDSDRADNAQFWIGECYMSLKHYEKAILAYQEVIKKYPKGNKVPNALLRQAAAFEEINDKTSSRLLLKKIVKNYPKSSEAEIARKKLAALK